jgi:uncharacterized damage-inducible protein DinB
MTTVEEIRELFDYNRWARDRMMDAAATLASQDFVRDLGSSFPSVRDTLVHIMSAEWVWLNRWRGTSPTAMPEAWRSLALETLRTQWSELDAAYAQFLAALRNEDLQRTIDYRNLAGQAGSATLLQMLRHVINHSTYHRGQLTTMLRQLGATPPGTDLIFYYRTIAASAV